MADLFSLSCITVLDENVSLTTAVTNMDIHDLARSAAPTACGGSSW
jgi:hypothetical protein